ncbi:MAG TPA: glycoside hydrolase family 31 protein [Herpetosiphonaceae bacterium]
MPDTFSQLGLAHADARASHVYHQLGPVAGYAQDGATLTLAFGAASVAVTALTDRIIRVRLGPGGAFAPRRSWAAAAPDEAFPGALAEVSAAAGALIARTGLLEIEISRETGRIAFRDARGLEFCADAAPMAWGAGGVRGAKRIEQDEHFYGFGERTGGLDKRGSRLVNWATDEYRYGPASDPLYIAIPTLLALRPGLAYGVFFNNSWRSGFDMGAGTPDAWTMASAGGELDYYLCYGPTPAEVLEGFAAILGVTPLPPRWALGYHQSRWGYSSADEIRSLAAELRRRELPCDVIHLDIDYMDGYRDFTWNSERFPDPAGLISELRDQGFRVVTIVDPGVKADPAYAVYQDGLERDMFIRRADGEVFHGYVWPDDSVFPDFTRPEVRAWWGEMQGRLVAAGASGIWNDMNEPTVFKRPFSEGGGEPHTIDLDAVQGAADERTSHAEVHNLYGSGMARASYEGLRRQLGARPFVLTRSGFAGIQRWSACWMGDNTSAWEYLALAIPQLLNMGLSGAPFAGTDIGGFFDNASGELFARWMQFGILMPFCRGHSHTETSPHEPWVFGPRVEAICREYLGLRYQLLPYLYTLFWEASRRGAPILRPLCYEFPDDPATYRLEDQAMLGPAILAAPVYQPGAEEREVYLPAGAWYDWWSGAVCLGPAKMMVAAPLERMPLFVRAGSLIPGAQIAQSTVSQSNDYVTLDVYPGTGAFTLYEDDGASFEHEQGAFCATTYRVERAGSALLLSQSAREGAFQPPARRLLLRIHGVAGLAGSPPAGAVYNSERRLLTVELADNGAARELAFDGLLFDRALPG